jgi:hypothetical protein
MSTLVELEAERAAAGAAYVKAIGELRIAFVRLAAIDRTLQNAHVAATDVRTFHPNRIRLAEALRSFQHAEFYPHLTVNQWNDPIVPISDAQINNFKPG